MRAPGPGDLPPLRTMLAELAHHRPKAIAKHLGIAPSTLETYHRRNDAPRAVLMALWWETWEGRQLSDCDAGNWAALAALGERLALQKCEQLTRLVMRLESELQAPAPQAANLPVWRTG